MNTRDIKGRKPHYTWQFGMYFFHRRYERMSGHEQAVSCHCQWTKSKSMICSGWPQFFIYKRCPLRAARRKGDEDRVASAVCAVDKAGTDINVLIKPWQQLGRGEGSRNKESGEYNLFILPRWCPVSSQWWPVPAQCLAPGPPPRYWKDYRQGTPGDNQSYMGMATQGLLTLGALVESVH